MMQMAIMQAHALRARESTKDAAEHKRELQCRNHPRATAVLGGVAPVGILSAPRYVRHVRAQIRPHAKLTWGCMGAVHTMADVPRAVAPRPTPIATCQRAAHPPFLPTMVAAFGRSVVTSLGTCIGMRHRTHPAAQRYPGPPWAHGWLSRGDPCAHAHARARFATTIRWPCLQPKRTCLLQRCVQRLLPRSLRRIMLSAGVHLSVRRYPSSKAPALSVHACTHARAHTHI